MHCRLSLVLGLALPALLADAQPAEPEQPAQKMRIIFGSIERVGPWSVPQ